ncbi:MULTISPECIES: N-6 DNA methylase [unclassified Mesorhizobium]|uniref:N-6 DNA methylase n=1 Tax=unclassified Mesorhizobium TaxID=325217 RepID=UPI001AEDDE9D|nr:MULTISPECIES: N-6 DNA methylase [unclassified Mesorhizobium]MCA0028279.1 N-6 DNA methylase [Mesorhizobium sp. B263B1A]
MELNPRIKIRSVPDGKICDFIDGRLRADTPEEYVRQNIERRLVLELGFQPSNIRIEFPIKVGSATKKIDIAIFKPGDPHVQENVWIIVECKRDNIPPADKKEGVGQLQSYLAACANSQWGMWTNGRFKEVYHKVTIAGRIEFEEPNDIPAADGNTTFIDRPTRGKLNQATDDNLLFSFKICHNHIYITDGLQKQPAFFELLKVIFCKIEDERNIPNDLEFFATAKEKGSPDGRLTVKKRMSKIFDGVKKKYPAIFQPNDQINLDPRSLSYIVGELQRYSLLNTKIDVKGKAYEEIVGANLRGDRGEFFTPRNIQRMCIQMLEIKQGEKILDPACGTGGFLVIAMNDIISTLREKGETFGNDFAEALRDRIKAVASSSFFGFDINPDLVKATKMNMVMNNDGSGNILRNDSLRHPHEWSSEFRNDLANALGIDPLELRTQNDLGHFDVIATNPPFGSKLPVQDTQTLQQYDLGHVWEEDADGNWTKKDEISKSQPPEILFIERCYQLLRDGGRMAIVLPDAILGAPGLGYVRQWILEKFRLVASVDLHPDAFQPRNGTQTSVLLLQRKTQAELNREKLQNSLNDYSIFMAQNLSVGHDKRGNKVFLRNEEGEEILIDTPDVIELSHTADGEATTKPMPRQKILDDDTPEIATAFRTWKAQAVLGW